MQSMLMLILLAFAAGATVRAQDIATAPTTVQRESVGPRTGENIPPIPADLAANLARYQNTRGASFSGWLPDGSLLITTRFGETSQAHRVKTPMGMREQLTFFKEPLSNMATAPGHNGFVYGQDIGGSEFWQLFYYDLDTRQTTLLTDGKRSRNEQPLWSHDGTQLAYSSTVRNGTDTDIFVRDMRSGRSKSVVAEGGTWYPFDFSPDGRRLLVAKYVSINEAYPGVVDLTTGKLELFPVDGGKAGFNAFVFGPDGKQVYFVSDEKSEFRTLRFHDPDAGKFELLSAKIPWDVQAVDVAANGKHLAYLTNEDGIGQLHVIALPSHAPVALPKLPIGFIGNVEFSPNGEQLALTLNSSTSPSDVYVMTVDTKSAPVRWTASEVGGLDSSQFIAPTLVRYPTFDKVDGKPRTIPAFYYRPPGDGPFPVVINIHGGPEAQALPAFNPLTQYLLRELEIAVLFPNVRGSAGYGKSYLQLDNGKLREDSVKDIGALLDWIATQPDLDKDRVAVAGGSYGGYMVLASMAHYNDRLRAGISVVGISDFATFLKNTESYRRDLRRAEYGDEREPSMAEFHKAIAPLNNAHKISKPLFVAQGFNDPRVPYTEAEQIVSKVRGNGGDVWYLMFADEGHGFAKKTNKDYYDAASMLFWKEHLLDE